MAKKSCICLICLSPRLVWFNFLSTFTNYDIYVIVDDNSTIFRQKQEKFKNINIIQIKNDECEKAGFLNTCSIPNTIPTVSKSITGWSKAIYYFSTIIKDYDSIWFIEDDVFFYNEQTLINIDSKYSDSDLLSNKTNNNYVSGPKDFWQWEYLDIKFDPPYYRALVSIVRMSAPLLSKIKAYANEHNRVFYIEALFPTICANYNLKHDTPTEFRNVVFRKDYLDEDINTSCLYHPLKNTDKHVYYRSLLSADITLLKN